MPDTTPIYGFTYPCPGELVTAADITLLAGQIDTVGAALDTDWFEMLNRRNTIEPSGATQNILAGVETVLATPVYTFPVAGVYLVGCGVLAQSSPATINMFRARLRHNATVRFGVTNNTENFIIDSPNARVTMIAAAGDTATITTIYNGTGNMNVSGRISAKLLCRIA